jgi:hypothetical protein
MLLRMRNFTDIRCRDNENMHLMFKNYFPKIVPFIRQCINCCRTEEATDDNITQHVRFACWITKAINTHSKYVICIAFPRQKWLHKRASMLRLYVIDCFVIYKDESSFSGNYLPKEFAKIVHWSGISMSEF